MTVYEINWKLVSDGLIPISFKSIGVFPAVFSVAGLGSWESGSLPVPSVGVGAGPRWAVATSPAVPGFHPRRLKRLQDQPGLTQARTLRTRGCSERPDRPEPGAWPKSRRRPRGRRAEAKGPPLPGACRWGRYDKRPKPPPSASLIETEALKRRRSDVSSDTVCVYTPVLL